MSDTMPDTSASLANEGRDAETRLLDAQGRVMNRGARQAQGTLEQIETYVREQPFSAALLALGIGYILGRLHLI